MTEITKDLYRLRIYYSMLVQLLELHFGTGYFVLSSEDANRHYLRLCLKIEEILVKPEFQTLASENWKPFENILSIDPDYPEGDWEYGKQQMCADFRSELEKVFIKTGENKYELDIDDQKLLVEINNFLEQYKRVKDKEPEKLQGMIDNLKPFFPQTKEEVTSKQDAKSPTLDIPKDDFQGIMNVFISHRFVSQDQKLAVTLRDVLKSKKIGGYLAESNQEYELRLDEKIRERIKNSDYVVGIITNNSKDSASVNQELGFALGDKTPLIIMVEKSVPHGVLTTSRETAEFTEENFIKQCELVADYILEKGGTKRSDSRIKSGQYDIVLDKFTENGVHHVGIRNAKGKTITSCIVLCDYQKCEWWDTHDSNPRNIMEGEAGNVILPRGFANTNPAIGVMSGDYVLERILLSKITRRPSDKWSAEDENIERVERLNTALNRIRSNLATLRNLFQLFNISRKDIPISDPMKDSISQKNELIEDTQTVVNQSSHVLEPDWVHQLNDLCRLAKNNPGLPKEGPHIIQCEYCMGIISQIDGLLTWLPNPPV